MDSTCTCEGRAATSLRTSATASGSRCCSGARRRATRAAGVRGSTSGTAFRKLAPSVSKAVGKSFAEADRSEAQAPAQSVGSGAVEIKDIASSARSCRAYGGCSAAPSPRRRAGSARRRTGSRAGVGTAQTRSTLSRRSLKPPPRLPATRSALGLHWEDVHDRTSYRSDQTWVPVRASISWAVTRTLPAGLDQPSST